MSFYHRVFITVCLLQILFIKRGVITKEHGDDICYFSTGQTGVCRMPENCPNSYYVKYKNCKEHSPMVCCPTKPVISELFKSKADLKCQEYCMFYLLNGYYFKFPESLIVGGGGRNADPKDRIYMAILGYDVNGINHWGCGGSLISEEYILTAAHCTFNINYGEVKRARLGDLDINRYDDDAEPQDFDIVERINHPDYKPPSKYNDIALLKLNKKAELTSYVYPACVTANSNVLSSERLYQAAGWGQLGFNKPSSGHLQILDMQLFTNAECNMYYQAFFPTRKLNNGILDTTQICAGHRTKFVDTCEGDSGGPLVLKYTEGIFNVIGITSFGLPCATSHAPGIYTRVAPFISWIESIVWP